MKKVWSILFCAALLWTLCACGQSPAVEDAGKPAAQSEPAPTDRKSVV